MTASTICKSLHVVAIGGVKGAIPCSSVISNLIFFLSFVMGITSNPLTACCNGIKSLNGAAKATPDKQTVCMCVKATTSSYKYRALHNFVSQTYTFM